MRYNGKSAINYLAERTDTEFYIGADAVRVLEDVLVIHMDTDLMAALECLAQFDISVPKAISAELMKNEHFFNARSVPERERMAECLGAAVCGIAKAARYVADAK